MNINRLLKKDKPYAPSIMYELCMSAESIWIEWSGSRNEHEKETLYDSDEDVAYMFKNSFDEEELTPQWDTNTLQDMLFAIEDTKENYNDQDLFLTYA